MVKRLVHQSDEAYEWIDILDPQPGELQQVAAELGLHEASIQDALQADHLPKYERLRDYVFCIIRYYAPENTIESDTIQELTDKMAIVIAEKYIITIHKKEWSKATQINHEYFQSAEFKDTSLVLNKFIWESLKSFEAPASKLRKDIEYYEEQFFLKERNRPVLKGLYFIKRKVDVIKRLVSLYYDIIDHIDPPGGVNAFTRDTRDLYIKQLNDFGSLSENINQLLTIYFNISSQRTNDTVRILTIFSVFFMPLTFIVGIYGMNFDFMPELKWKWGYPAAIVSMVLITIIIYTWFKRKKWL